jgi:hypothetical protein
MEPRVPKNLICTGDAELLGMEGERELCHAFLIKPSIFGGVPGEIATLQRPVLPKRKSG